MMYRALVVGLAASASAMTLKQSNDVKPIMKLRGGLAGIDAEPIAKAVIGLSVANAGVMALAPKKAGEMYGVADTKWTTFFAQWSGMIMLGQMMTAFLAIGGMDMGDALGWGMVPSAITSVQDFLNDRMVGEMGMGMPAKFMPTIVNVFFCLGLFGKIPGVDVDLVKKISAVWIGANGLFGYFNTDGWMAGWGGTGLTAADKGMGRLMAQCMVASAVYTVGTAFLGKSALECFGLLMAVYGLGSIDFIFVSKTMEAMGVDSAPGLFWLAIQAATTALIFL